MIAISGTSCKNKNPFVSGTEDQARAESQVRTTIDDFFAYLKTCHFEKMATLTDGSSTAPDTLTSMLETPLAPSLEAACGRIRADIKSVSADPDEKTAEVTVSISYIDQEYLLNSSKSSEDGFASEKALKSAIESVPSSDIDMELDLAYDEKWRLTGASMDSIYDSLFSFFDLPELIAAEPEPDEDIPVLGISVFESYWVDRQGNETSGYHCSDTKICLYCYTWNTYKNVTVRYEYTDINGQVLYENTYTISNNSDWICCVWPVNTPLPEGPLYIKLYEPAGVLFHTKEVRIYPDGEILPFPMEVVYSCWNTADGEEVGSYMADTDYISYQVVTLNFYKSLELKYEYTDDEGNVLYEGKYCDSENTDHFYFAWEGCVIPEEVTVLHLSVKTAEDEPFCQADILIMPVPVEESSEPVETSHDS